MNTFFCRAFQCCFAVGARFLPWVGYWKASDAYDTARPPNRQWELLPHSAAFCQFASCALHFVNMYKNAQFIYRSFEIFVHLCYDTEKETEEPFALSFLPHQRKEPTL